VLYFMSPNLYTDYLSCMFRVPAYISTSPAMVIPSSISKSSSPAVSIPPTHPNTINSPTINLIILISLSSQHVSSKVFPFFVAGTNLCNSNQSTERYLFGFLAYFTNKSKSICLNGGIVLW
jgi:hypothetical protein